jgi:DNA-binding NarL/FixJ family response regulator
MSKVSNKQTVVFDKPDATKCRIVILDDQPIFCEGIKRLMEKHQNMEVAGVFDRKSHAFTFLRCHDADLILLELNLRQEIGLELIKDLRTEFGKLRILVFTDRDEMVYGERAMLAGAQGYLMKNSSPETLVKVIGKLMQGEIFLSEQLMAHLLKRTFMSGRASQAGPAKAMASLTDREFEVFELIGRGKGTREVAACLKLSVKTVENHREKVKKKLGIDNSSSLVHYATIWVYESNVCKGAEPTLKMEVIPPHTDVPMPLPRMAWGKEAVA